MYRSPVILPLLISSALALPTARQTESKEACLEVAEAQAALSSDDTLELPAELAHACLTSVRLVPEDAKDLLDGWSAVWEWQSDPTFLADPPGDYFYPAIDVEAEVSALRTLVDSGNLTSEYEFQRTFSNIIQATVDGHVRFNTDFNDVFSWSRGFDGLVSFSSDGQELPSLYVYEDIAGSSATDNASPIVQINGKNATEFLNSEITRFHDVDAAYNSWMVELDETDSDFSSPSYYPGPDTTITFENGTEVTRQNTASTRKNFSSVEDGASFYHEFCNATNKLDPDDVESSAEEERVDDDFPYSRIAKRESLEAVFETDDGTVSTFIIPATDDSESTAVITIARFSNELFSLQETMSNFLDTCREQNVKHLVVELSSNTGGNVMATYEIFKHLFPDITPFFARNYRAQPQMEFMGKLVAEATLAALEEHDGNWTAVANDVSVNNNNAIALLDTRGSSFPNWDSFAGPVTHNGDNFTQMWNFDISSVAVSQNAESRSFGITGYGDKSETKPQPFESKNIVMLSNGKCSSSCGGLAYMLKYQGKVKSVVLGGRPQPGPMQHPGGVKGGTVVSLNNIMDRTRRAMNYVEDPPAPEEGGAPSLAKLIELGPYLLKRTRNPSQDTNIRINAANRFAPEDLSTGLPMQFKYEAADCRLWFTQDTFKSREAQWDAARVQAFGFGTDAWSGCIEGSTGHKTSLSGNAELYNRGTPQNVTGYDPPNTGTQKVPLDWYNLD